MPLKLIGKKNHDDFFAGMLDKMIALWIVGAVVFFSAIIGIIYFIFWSLQHFGIV
jgi:hypothetical protein